MTLWHIICIYTGMMETIRYKKWLSQPKGYEIYQTLSLFKRN